MSLIDVVLFNFPDILIEIVVVERGVILILFEDIIGIETEIDIRCFGEDRIIRRRQFLGMLGIIGVFRIILRCLEVVGIDPVEPALEA